MTDEQNCATCAHRYGALRTYWRCQAVGFFCDIEMQRGGKCSNGNDLLLWTPRRSLRQRFMRLIFGVDCGSNA